MILFKEEGDFKEGALISVDKPLKWTSFDVVNKIRWCLKEKYGKIKVGHAGTLDPLATGLVLICTGKWTKEIEKYMGQSKEYVAKLRFGATTPSFDLETEINREYPYRHITEDALTTALSGFIGEIEQKPPVFSAVNIDGQRAYKKARQGYELEMLSRKIYIKDIELLQFELPYAELKITCGKGTYIRSLARDIGNACQSGAHLSELRRTKIGEFQLEHAKKIEDLVALLRQIL